MEEQVFDQFLIYKGFSVNQTACSVRCFRFRSMTMNWSRFCVWFEHILIRYIQIRFNEIFHYISSQRIGWKCPFRFMSCVMRAILHRRKLINSLTCINFGNTKTCKHFVECGERWLVAGDDDSAHSFLTQIYFLLLSWPRMWHLFSIGATSEWVVVVYSAYAF